MRSPTPHVMESVLQVPISMLPIPPAILALVSSLMQEYHPWLSCVAIEMTPDSDSSQMWASGYTMLTS